MSYTQLSNLPGEGVRLLPHTFHLTDSQEKHNQLMADLKADEQEEAWMAI